MVRDFYGTLYTSEGTSGMGEVLHSVPVRVTRAMNEVFGAEGFHSIVNQKNSYGCEQESQDLI
jgi:hypothetical protein